MMDKTDKKPLYVLIVLIAMTVVLHARKINNRHSIESQNNMTTSAKR